MTTTPPPAERDHSNRAPGQQQGRRAGLTARYLQTVGAEVGADGLTPTALARAAARVLDVDATGLSTLSGMLRLPLGASSDDAARAEELQTTLSEGPCLDAAERQASVVVDHADLASRWPLYSDELTSKTPYRSVAAVALHGPGRGVFAALDLYSSDPDLAERLDLADIDTHVAAPAAALLSTCLDQIHDLEIPHAAPEWYQSAAGRRHEVWVAIGMVMATHPRRNRDALSLLRAHAYTQNRTLDDLATDIVHGQLPPTDITD